MAAGPGRPAPQIKKRPMLTPWSGAIRAMEAQDGDAAETAVHTHLRNQLVATTMPQILDR
ncbi:MAG: hypothetical protein QOI25_625 [Mycobacterium sp.]|jgi:hypothetical protein|nr:hypothetical protein [Mycobacterium sp.]MDT5322914.1 hypothetical protein [Mycobacterium sp.]